MIRQFVVTVPARRLAHRITKAVRYPATDGSRARHLMERLTERGCTGVMAHTYDKFGSERLTLEDMRTLYDIE